MEVRSLSSSYKGKVAKLIVLLAIRMATSSSPGGSIPNFIAQSQVPGQVCNDVPLFLKWLHSDRKNFLNDAEKPEPTHTETAPVAEPQQTAT